MARLIAVDDDPALLRLLAEGLGMAGHDLRLALSGAQLDQLLAEAPADLVILDLNLPGEDGLTIARRLRAGHDIGILMLTGSDTDTIAGLDRGADDYVTKPFSLPELAARIGAILRRRRIGGPHIRPFGALSVDLRNWQVLDPAGTPLTLFPTEIDLIATFATHPGKLLTRDDLLRLAPGQGDDPLDRSIDTRITRLRRKLEQLGLDPDVIRASRGNGYIYAG